MPSYIWPLSNSTTPDEMNTSFGPRIDQDHWDFHDGIDLPAPKGTPVHAMRGGRVHRAGLGGTDRFSSRHVVVKVQDPLLGLMYHVYLHLDSIDPGISVGHHVGQGQLIGTVGDDDATYPHLHMEMRRGTLREIGSVHPLGFLPYSDTVNFSPPASDRFNRLDGRMAARLLFGAGSKREGDLQRIEVELRRGTHLLTTRRVDFNDKKTINDTKGDQHRFTGGIAVEGYQKSNMVAHGRTDLMYGILVRSLPQQCDTLLARLIDVGGNAIASDPITIPNQEMTDEFLDFEDAQLPPSGWTKLVSGSGSGTSISITPSAAHSGLAGLLCEDESVAEGSSQRAAIEYALPTGRFEWRIQGWFNADQLELASGSSIYLLHLLHGAELSIAARIRNAGGILQAGLIARNADGALFRQSAAAEIEIDVWRQWTLELLRLGTRETTAILYLDRDGRPSEHARINWNSTGTVPTRLRAGIGFSSPGARARVRLDELWVTEAELPI